MCSASSQAVGRTRKKTTLGAVRGILEAHTPEARETKLDALWAIFIGRHSDDVLLCHPKYRPREGESKQ